MEEADEEEEAHLEHEAVAGDDEDAVVLAELGALHVLERVVRALCAHTHAYTCKLIVIRYCTNTCKLQVRTRTRILTISARH